MIVDQLAHAWRKPCEGKFMPAQNQMIIAAQQRQPFAGFDPFPYWIGHGFGRIHPNIRAD